MTTRDSHIGSHYQHRLSDQVSANTLYLTHPAPTAAGAPAAPPALPDKPSIAVLPFANLSGEPAQDYLADGLTDNLLDALAQNPRLFVIARNASLVYRGAFTYFDQADLGWAQDRVAALNRARQLADKVLQLDPEFAGPYWLRARLELQPDLPEYDPEAALRDARKSVELGPNEDPSHWTLGFVLFLLGHFDEAASQFATTLRLNPHPYIWELGLHAVALSATGHHKEAIAEIEAATAAQPKNPFGPSFRGQIEKFAGNYANAAGWFERAREADPASSQNALLLAEVYDRLGRVDEAISLLENGP